MAKRVKIPKGNQNPLIEGQTKQWPKDTKGESESVNRRTDKAMAKSVKIPKGNQNPLIEGQTKQWPKDTKGESESVNRRTDKAMAKRYQRGNQNP